MAMKQCPVCGEKYSDTYRRCPFCEEEEMLRSGAQSRRRGGHRAQQGGPSILSGILIVAILAMAAVLVYLLFGDAIAEKLGMGKVDPPPAASSAVVSSEQGSAATSSEEDPAASSNEGTDEPDGPVDPAVTDYETADALPKGLSLNTEDFSISVGDPDVALKVSGGSGSYTWFVQNPAIAEVSDSGVVKAVAGGTTMVAVTDGSSKGECIVRVKGGTQPADPGTPSSGSLKTGSATVIDAPGGVNVRPNAGTENPPIASLTNGNSVTVLENAGNGWYKIQFAGNGGVSTTGYIKGEFLRN